MCDGAEYYHRLRRASEDLKRRAADAAREAHGKREQLDRLIRQRGDALMGLARHYLPALDEEAIEGSLAGIRGELEDVLERRERHLADLVASSEQAEAQIDDLERRVDEVTEALNAKVDERDALELRLAEVVAEDAQMTALSEAAALAEDRLERNEERMAALDREAAEKLPAFEQDKLFQYLVQRRFGTADYGSRGLIRRLDRWVAGLVKFQEAKRSFDFLRVTPLLVRQEVERRGEEFEAQMKELEARRDAHAQELGLAAALAEGVRLGGERDRLVDELATAHDEEEQRLAERERIERHQGRFYAEAVQRFRDFLATTRSRRLESHAESTPDPEDDELVSKLRSAERALDGLEPDLEELDEDAVALAERARGLEELLGRYRRENFDSSRSRFHGDAPERELKDYVRGRMSAAQLWESIHRRQRFRPPPLPERRTKRGWPGGPRPGSPVTETVIDVVGEALRQAMARGIYRRGRRGGWQWGGGMSFPDFPKMPRFPNLPRSGGRGRSKRIPKGRSGRKRRGFSTRDGF